MVNFFLGLAKQLIGHIVELVGTELCLLHHVNVHVKNDSSKNVVVNCGPESHAFGVELCLFVICLFSNSSPKWRLKFIKGVPSVQKVLEIKGEYVVASHDIWVIVHEHEIKGL